MRVVEPPPAGADGTPAPATVSRPVGQTLLLWLRRAHLYCGLLLLPWAVLYGVTAFLFNHPTFLSEQPMKHFGAEALSGTPLEAVPSPTEQAEQVVQQLNATQKPATPYKLAGEAKYGREFAFATVQAEGQNISVLIDVKNGWGTIRATPAVEKKQPEKAPFAVGAPAGERRSTSPPGGGGIKLDNPLHERVKDAVPVVLERNGFAPGTVTVTSVPDVVFPIEADGKVWTATYNAMSGAVSGTPASDTEQPELGWRRFALRLHTAHGYPGETNARWFWAVVVDAMAFVLLFWGISGLFMWWQIKATRKLGFVLLALSAVSATALGVAMHAAMTT